MKKPSPRQLLAPLLVFLGVFLGLAESASGKIELRSEITDSGIFLSGPSRVGKIAQTSLNPRLANRASPTNHASDLSDWLSREPLGEGESLNLYAYCHGDPINKVDVLGLASIAVDLLPADPTDERFGSADDNSAHFNGFTLGMFEGVSPAEWARIDTLRALEYYQETQRLNAESSDRMRKLLGNRDPNDQTHLVGWKGTLHAMAGLPDAAMTFAFQDVLMGTWASGVSLFDERGLDPFSGEEVSRGQSALGFGLGMFPGMFLDDLDRAGVRGQKLVSKSSKFDQTRRLASGGPRNTIPLTQNQIDEALLIVREFGYDGDVFYRPLTRGYNTSYANGGLLFISDDVLPALSGGLKERNIECQCALLLLTKFSDTTKLI